MKIAIVSDYISSTENLECYQSQQLKLASELSKLGVDVDILTSKRRAVDMEYFELNEKVKVFRLPVIAKWTEAFLRQTVMLGLWNRLSQEKYDYIISSEFYKINTLIAGMHTVLRKDCKLIIFQGIYQYSVKKSMKFIMATYSSFMAPLLKRICYKAICKTTSAAKYLEQKGFTKTVVVPVGVDTSIFFPEQRDQTEIFKMLVIGELIPRKNYTLVLESFRQLNKLNDKIHLTIIGKGPDKYLIEDFIRNNRFDNKITFIDAVPNNQLQQYYNKADIFLLFSKVEIFGMVLLEAMACGCPVISTPTAGTLDVITDGVNGFILEDENPNQIASKIAKIIKNSSEYKQIRKIVAQGTQQKYSWQVIAQQYYALLNKSNN